MLSFCDLARGGRECSITCTTTDLTESITFYKGNIRKASCSVVPGLSSAKCVTVSKRYSIEQSRNTSETILHIKNVSRVLDTGEWNCRAGERDGPSKLLQIYGMKMARKNCLSPITFLYQKKRHTKQDNNTKASQKVRT